LDRRKFVKVSGVGLAALGSGVISGAFFKHLHKSADNFSVFAFLPGDNETIFNCLKLFQRKINNSTFGHLVERKNMAEIMNKKFSSPDNENTSLTERYYDINLIKLNQKVSADIFVSNSFKIFLDPYIDFENELMRFRDSINKKPGGYLLSIELKESNYLSDFIPAKNKFVKIENSFGLFDKISASQNYSSVIVPGSIGKTELMIHDGKVNIKSSPCKHNLCRIMAQLSGSNIIACVPNKVLITLT